MLGLGLGLYKKTNNISSIPTFSPTDLPNLALWLDASSSSNFALNGNQVQTWFDLSGNNKHATQNVSTWQPIYDGDINGITTVDFNGLDEFLNFDPVQIGSRSNSLYIVLKNNEASFKKMRFFVQEISDGRTRHMMSFRDNGLAFINSDTFSPTTTPDYRSGVLITKGYKDGSEVGVGYNDDSYTTSSLGKSVPSIVQSSIGKAIVTNAPFNGEIAEIILTLDRSEEDEVKILNYLNSKWGVY